MQGSTPLHQRHLQNPKTPKPCPPPTPPAQPRLPGTSRLPSAQALWKRTLNRQNPVSCTPTPKPQDKLCRGQPQPTCSATSPRYIALWKRPITSPRISAILSILRRRSSWPVGWGLGGVERGLEGRGKCSQTVKLACCDRRGVGEQPGFRQGLRQGTKSTHQRFVGLMMCIPTGQMCPAALTTHL